MSELFNSNSECIKDIVFLITKNLEFSSDLLSWMLTCKKIYFFVKNVPPFHIKKKVRYAVYTILTSCEIQLKKSKKIEYGVKDGKAIVYTYSKGIKQEPREVKYYSKGKLHGTIGIKDKKTGYWNYSTYVHGQFQKAGKFVWNEMLAQR